MQVQEALARGRNVRPPTHRVPRPCSWLPPRSGEHRGYRDGWPVEDGGWRMEDGGCSVLGVRCSEVAGGQCRLCGPPRFNAPRQGRRSLTSGFPRPTSRVRLPASGFPRPTSRVRPDPTAQSQQTKRQPRAVGSGRRDHAPPPSSSSSSSSPRAEPHNI